MTYKSTTLDQIEVAVKAMRDFEDRENVKIGPISLLPPRLRDDGQSEASLLARVNHNGTIKMVGTGWFLADIEGNFWGLNVKEFGGKVICPSNEPYPNASLANAIS